MAVLSRTVNSSKPKKITIEGFGEEENESLTVHYAPNRYTPKLEKEIRAQAAVAVNKTDKVDVSADAELEDNSDKEEEQPEQGTFLALMLYSLLVPTLIDGTPGWDMVDIHPEDEDKAAKFFAKNPNATTDEMIAKGIRVIPTPMTQATFEERLSIPALAKIFMGIVGDNRPNDLKSPKPSDTFSVEAIPGT